MDHMEALCEILLIDFVAYFLCFQYNQAKNAIDESPDNDGIFKMNIAIAEEMSFILINVKKINAKAFLVKELCV